MCRLEGTLDELTQYVAARFRKEGIPSQYSTHVAQALIKEFGEHRIPSPTVGHLGFLLGCYAIRKDDLNVFEAFTTAIHALVRGNAITGGQLGIPELVCIIIAIAKPVRQLIHRGAIIDQDAVHVLTILQRYGSGPDGTPMYASEVLGILQHTRPEFGIHVVEKQLSYLREVATHDGGVTALASCDPLGRWRAHV